MIRYCFCLILVVLLVGLIDETSPRKTNNKSDWSLSKIKGSVIMELLN